MMSAGGFVTYHKENTHLPEGLIGYPSFPKISPSFSLTFHSLLLTMSGMLTMQRDGFQPIDEESIDIWGTYRESDVINSSGRNTRVELNPEFICYSGKEIVTGDLSDEDIRRRAYHAANLMRDSYERFYLGAWTHEPSTVAVMVVQQCDGRNKLYYHGNMGRRIQTTNASAAAQLAESFQSQMTLRDQNLPFEHPGYQHECAPYTNPLLADTERVTGFRTYFITRDPLGFNTLYYGCPHLTVAFDAEGAIHSPAEGFTFGSDIFYYWRSPEPDPSIIACRITPFTAAVLVADIADDVAMEMTLEDTAERGSSVLEGSEIKIDPKYRSDVRKFSQSLAIAVCDRYDSQVAGQMCRRENFNKLLVVAQQGQAVASAEALAVADGLGINLDENIMSLISQEVGGRVGLYVSRTLAEPGTVPYVGSSALFYGHL